MQLSITVLLLVIATGYGGLAYAADGLTLEPISIMQDDTNGFYALDNPREIEIFSTGSQMYAAVAASDGIQIIDITDPTNPIPVKAIRDHNDLSGVFEADGHPYIVLDGHWDKRNIFNMSVPSNSVILNDIKWRLPDGSVNTDPYFLNRGGGYYTEFPRTSMPISIFSIDERAYALVSARQSEYIILDITDPTRPQYTGEWPEWSVGMFEVQGRTYSIFGPHCHIQVRDITNPGLPVNVTGVLDCRDGYFDAGYSPKGVATAEWMGRTYTIMFRASGSSGSMTTIDVTDPSQPTPIGTIRSEWYGSRAAGFEYLDDIGLVRQFMMLGDTYIVMTDSRSYSTSAGLRIISITDPTRPMPAGGSDYSTMGLLDVGHPIDIEVIESDGRHYVMASFGHYPPHALLIMEIVSGPDEPQPVEIVLETLNHTQDIMVSVTGNSYIDQDFDLTVHVQYPDGTVTEISHVRGMLEFGDTVILTSRFIPPESGVYTIRASALDGTILSTPPSVTIVAGDNAH